MPVPNGRIRHFTLEAMNEIWFELQEQLSPALRASDLAYCERVVSARLVSLPLSPFHIAPTLTITNSPADVAAHFDGFFRQEAAYAEMNGFDINPDRWFFDVFAFDKYGGHEDYDWLSDWRSEGYDDMTITGLELLQQVYARINYEERQFKDAENVASLLIVIKFQDLIRRAAPLMRELRWPLLATAHDYDFIFEIRPEG